MPIQKGPANWEWMQAVIRALDHIPVFNSRLIDATTRDVYVYFTCAGVRAQIDKVIAYALGEGPCVVLAHSLGTVVTCNVLRPWAATPRYPKLVTVGSSLGSRAIKQLATPLISPPCIGQWFNAYDDRDIVALVPLDAQTLNITPLIENKRDVLNFTENRHGVEGYLTDLAVAQQVVQGLQNLQPDKRPPK